MDRPGEMRALSAAIGRRSVAWKGWARSGREDEGSRPSTWDADFSTWQPKVSRHHGLITAAASWSRAAAPLDYVPSHVLLPLESYFLCWQAMDRVPVSKMFTRGARQSSSSAASALEKDMQRGKQTCWATKHLEDPHEDVKIFRRHWFCQQCNVYEHLARVYDILGPKASIQIKQCALAEV